MSLTRAKLFACLAAVLTAASVHAATVDYTAVPAGNKTNPYDTGGITAIVATTDGKSIFTAGADGKIIVWNPDGTKVKTIDASEGPIKAMVFVTQEPPAASRWRPTWPSSHPQQPVISASRDSASAEAR